MAERKIGQSKLSGQKETACTFCQIIKGEKESYMISEDAGTMAFLDIRPLFPGHILLVPKVHYKSISHIPDSIIGKLFNNAKSLSGALEAGLGAEGTFIAVNDKISQSVPHLHIHVVPRRSKDGLKGFFWPRYKYKNEEEIRQVQLKIIGALKGRQRQV